MQRGWFLAAILGILSTSAFGAEPHGRIGEKYRHLGGATGALGPAIGNEADAQHGGRLHLFKHGMVFWHPEIGEAFAVWGSISSKFGPGVERAV